MRLNPPPFRIRIHGSMIFLKLRLKFCSEVDRRQIGNNSALNLQHEPTNHPSCSLPSGVYIYNICCATRLYSWSSKVGVVEIVRQKHKKHCYLVHMMLFGFKEHENFMYICATTGSDWESFLFLQNVSYFL